MPDHDRGTEASVMEMLCTSQAKAIFVPPQNNSGEISLSWCVSLSVLYLFPSSLQQWKPENKHWTKYTPGSTSLNYLQQEWIWQPTSQQTMCGFQRPSPLDLNAKHMHRSHSFFPHFKICLTLLYAQCSTHGGTYRCPTHILQEKSFKAGSARSELETQR